MFQVGKSVLSKVDEDTMAAVYGTINHDTEAAVVCILGTGSNKMKLVANYVLEHPGVDPASLTDSKLITYIHAKGYGGKGYGFLFIF